MRNKFFPIIIISAFAIMLSGCNLFGHSYNPSVSGIYIDSDRKVTSAEITSFDNSGFETPRYVPADCKAYAEETVSAFNDAKVNESVAYKKAAKGDLPVYIDEIEFDDTKGKLLLVFQNYEYYLEFFGTSEAVPVKKLVVGSVADGITSGLDFMGMVDAEGNEADPTTIKENSKYTLIKIQGDTEVQTAGKIVYRSAEITSVDEYTVTVAGDQVGYIIFK